MVENAGLPATFADRSRKRRIRPRLSAQSAVAFSVTSTRRQPEISHRTAVLIIAAVATIWGFGFPATRIVLDGGLSVGALMGLRFPLAGLVMFAIIRTKGIRITRRGVLDGIWLGLVLVVVFWLQTDGMRFTTTAKAGFITGLYVLFTPLVAVAIGQRVKLASALGALIAAYGMYLLVHLHGAWWSGWNRGDIEILLCAILSGIHIVMMGAFTRRSEAWLLAGAQVMICGVVSVGPPRFCPRRTDFRMPSRRCHTGRWWPRRSTWRSGPRSSLFGDRRPRRRDSAPRSRRCCSAWSRWWRRCSASSG